MIFNEIEKYLPGRKLLYVLVSNSPVVSDESGFLGNESHLYSFAVFQVEAPIQAHSPLGMILNFKPKNYYVLLIIIKRLILFIICLFRNINKVLQVNVVWLYFLPGVVHTLDLKERLV